MTYENDTWRAPEGPDLRDRDSGGAPPSEPAEAPASADPVGEPEAPVAPGAFPPPDEVAAEEEAAEHQARVARDLDELAARAEKAEQYLELAQRTQADFENYRKRAARDAAAAQERGVVKLARELLPAVDDLDRALQAAQAASDGDNRAEMLASGVKLVHAGVLAALARVGIECYSPEGEPFDPVQHEAVAQQPAEGLEMGTIVEVYQRGYRLGDSVLRPARVVVAG